MEAYRSTLPQPPIFKGVPSRMKSQRKRKRDFGARLPNRGWFATGPHETGYGYLSSEGLKLDLLSPDLS
jgi:hypothetical protein